MNRKRLQQAIAATREEDYLRGLTLFLDFYGSEDAPPVTTDHGAEGLSFFALCLALVRKDYKEAVILCTRAIGLQFYNGDHYENLTRIYTAAGRRRKAIETVEQGLKVSPDHEGLAAVRKSLGIRARPPLPFIDRAHPINVTLGQVRHARKQKAKK